MKNHGFNGVIPPNVSLENNIRIALAYRDSHPEMMDRIN
jgi:hypothetical protein